MSVFGDSIISLWRIWIDFWFCHNLLYKKFASEIHRWNSWRVKEYYSNLCLYHKHQAILSRRDCTFLSFLFGLFQKSIDINNLMAKLLHINNDISSCMERERERLFWVCVFFVFFIYLGIVFIFNERFFFMFIQYRTENDQPND